MASLFDQNDDIDTRNLLAAGWTREARPTRSGRTAYVWRDPEGVLRTDAEAREWLRSNGGQT